MGLFAGTPFDRPPHCEVCERLESECICPPPEPLLTPPEKQRLKIGVEKRKRGKLVTVVRGLADEYDHIPKLLTQLKTECGAGGTLKDGEIEIQGDHVDRVRDSLTQKGYRIAK